MGYCGVHPLVGEQRIQLDRRPTDRRGVFRGELDAITSHLNAVLRLSLKAQVRPTLASRVDEQPVSTPTAKLATASESTPSSNNKLAIGLGVGIPLALLAILSVIEHKLVRQM